MQVITTERLVIRPIEPGDCEAVHRYAGDPSIDMMLFLPKTEEETREFVAYAVAEWKKSEPEVREYVILRDGEIIGGVMLETCEENRNYELGWVVRKDARGNGYASEAAKALAEYAFRELNAEQLQAHCDNRNAASERVMQKLGMVLADDTGTRTYPKTGVVSGECLYVLGK